MTSLLAAADSGHVEVIRELLKHRNCVVTAIKKLCPLVAENWRLCEKFKETWLSEFHYSSRDRKYGGTTCVAE
jgi:transposase